MQKRKCNNNFSTMDTKPAFVINGRRNEYM